MKHKELLDKEIQYAESQGFKTIIRERANGVSTIVGLNVTDEDGGAVIFQYQDDGRIMRTLLSLEDIAHINRSIVEVLDEQERMRAATYSASPTGVLN